MAAAVNEVTNRIYVVNYASSDVTVIDGASNRPIATVKVGLWPQQIAINTKTNMIYVVNTHANSVSVIDGRTNTVAATVPADKGPWAVAVNPVTNMIYVANRLSDKVTVIDGRTNGACSGNLRPGGSGGSPGGHASKGTSKRRNDAMERGCYHRSAS